MRRRWEAGESFGRRRAQREVRRGPQREVWASRGPGGEFVRRRSRVVELSAGPVLCAGEASCFVRQGANHVEGFVRP